MSYEILFKTQIQKLLNYMEDRLPNNHIELAFTNEYGFYAWWDDFHDDIFNQSEEMMIDTNDEAKIWIGENFFEKWMVLVEKVEEEEEEFFGGSLEMYEEFGKILTDPSSMYITFINKFVYWVSLDLIRDRRDKLYEKLQKTAITLQKHWRECRYNPEFKMCETIFEKRIGDIELPNI